MIVLNPTIENMLRKTFLYRKVYKPLVTDRKKAAKNKAKATLFAKEGMNMLKTFVSALNGNQIDWWLEFGTLLGMYREHDFIKGDLDMDFGVWLSDADKIHEILTSNGFSLARDYRVIGESGIERTYALGELTLDLFFFYENAGMYHATGFIYMQKPFVDRPSYYGVAQFTFKPFKTMVAEFKGLKVRIPDNVEEHIIESYGPGWAIPDPTIKDGFNKVKYDFSQKKGMGYFVK